MDLVAHLKSTANILEKNNTTTATNDLSNGLTKRVTRVYKGLEGMYERQPVMVNQYPVVFVEIRTHGEEFAELGKSAKREITTGFDIVGITHCGMGTKTEDIETTENSQYECIQLISNIENILRNNIRLSQTAVTKSLIINTDYSERPQENYINNVARIELEVELLTS